MSRKPFLLFIALTLSLGMWAQLSGNVEGSGLWNFNPGNKEDVKLNLRFDTTTLTVSFNLSGGHKYNPTNEITSILDMKKSDFAYSKYEDKQITKRNWYINTGLNFLLKLTQQDKLNVGLQYSYNGDKSKPFLASSRYALSGDSLTGTQKDTSGTSEYIYRPRLTYTHQFRKADNQVCIDMTGLIDMKDENFVRATAGDFYKVHRYYSTRNSINDADAKMVAFYEDKSLGKVKDLYLKAGVDLVYHNDIDIFAGWNNVDGLWRDSDNLDRYHLYSAVALEPNIYIAYKYKGFEFYVNERVQYYYHQLVNQLPEQAEQSIDFRKSEWQNILAADIGYRFNNRHRLDLTYQRTLDRPKYEKFNPVYTIGKSEGEYFHGNPNLRPTSMHDVGFTYGFMADHFGTDLTIGYRYTKDKVEKVIEIVSADTTFYTYINAKKQHTGGLMLDLKVDYDAVKAKMWLGTYYDVFIKQNNNTYDKSDFNFEVGISLDAYLTKSMKLSSDLLYRSAKASAYNLKGEYIGSDVSLTKTFDIYSPKLRTGNSKLDLYVKINDLVDKPHIEETWNAAYTYYKAVTKMLNRRSIHIGINYRF